MRFHKWAALVFAAALFLSAVSVEIVFAAPLPVPDGYTRYEAEDGAVMIGGAAGEVCDRMDRYHVYSTDNMVDWRDEGEIWRREQTGWADTPAEVDLDPSNSGLPSTFMWAPDCIYKNGKYYFYYPYPLNVAQEKEAVNYDGDYWNSTWRIGVLVSDFPDKGFESIGFVTEADGSPWVGNGRPFIDPNLFEDDDGKVYIFNGGGGKPGLWRRKSGRRGNIR